MSPDPDIVASARPEIQDGPTATDVGARSKTTRYDLTVLAACIGGHFTEPKEQKTQQSPGFGFISVAQLRHSWKCRHASVGMSSSCRKPQAGQVNVLCRIGAAMNDHFLGWAG